MRQEPIVIYINMWSEIDTLAWVFNKLYFQSEIHELDKERLLEMLKQGFVTMLVCFDLFLREVIVQEMGKIYIGKRKPSKGFNKFKLTAETILKLKHAKDDEIARDIFEEAVRYSLSKDQKLTLWNIEDIEKGFSFIGNEKFLDIVSYRFKDPKERKDLKDRVKSKLIEMSNRRNMMAHYAIDGYEDDKISWNYFYRCLTFFPDLMVDVYEYYKSQKIEN